jgi:hypothetical protein
MFRLIAPLLTFLLTTSAFAAEADQIGAVRRLFQQFVQLSQAFDVQVTASGAWQIVEEITESRP